MFHKLLKASLNDVLRFGGMKFAMQPNSSLGNCDPVIKSREYVGSGPLLGNVTFNRNSNAAVADLYSGKLQFPANFLMLASVGPAAGNNEDSLFVHFKTLGKTYTGTTIVPLGTEPWFNFRCGETPTNSMRDMSYIKLAPGIQFQEFWVDMGSESGTSAGAVTFIYTNHIDSIQIQARAPGSA